MRCAVVGSIAHRKRDKCHAGVSLCVSKRHTHRTPTDTHHGVHCCSIWDRVRESGIYEVDMGSGGERRDTR